MTLLAAGVLLRLCSCVPAVYPPKILFHFSLHSSLRVASGDLSGDALGRRHYSLATAAQATALWKGRERLLLANLETERRARNRKRNPGLKRSGSGAKKSLDPKKDTLFTPHT